MILRRLVARLRDGDYSALAAELFIVIVGVFLGIQVSNWNDARVDRARAHSYLERIRADLDEDIRNYRDRLGFWEEVSTYGRQALDYANTREPGSATEWELLLAFFQSSQMAEFYTTQSTYDELKSGGELGLIGDLELRKQLARYYTNANNPVLTERPAYREHVRGLIPLHVQEHIWQNCYSSDDETQTLLRCDSPISAAEAAALVTALGSNDALMAELRYWMSTMRVALIIGGDRTLFAERLRNTVNQQVEPASAGGGS